MAGAHSWICGLRTISFFCDNVSGNNFFLLDELVTCLAEVGLQLNVRKTKVLTTRSQSPTEVPLRNGQAIEGLDSGSTHKWLGCMLRRYALRLLAITVWILHITSVLRPKRFFCNGTIFGKQECCNARPFQVL